MSPRAERYEGRQNLRRISATEFELWLQRLGMGQSECARFLNVDPRTVRAWVLGERPVAGPAITALELLLSLNGKASLETPALRGAAPLWQGHHGTSERRPRRRG